MKRSGAKLTSAGAAARRPRRRGDSAKTEFRDAIIGTASDLLREEGFESVSIRNIAARVGVTPMAFYRYFESKREVVQCIWERTFAELLNALVGRMAAGTTPAERLTAFLNAYIDYWQDDPEAARAIFFGDGVYKSALAVEVNFVSNPTARPVLNLWEQVIYACLPKSDDRLERSVVLRDGMFWLSIGLVTATVLCDPQACPHRQRLRGEWVRAMVALAH